MHDTSVPASGAAAGSKSALTQGGSYESPAIKATSAVRFAPDVDGAETPSGLAARARMVHGDAMHADIADTGVKPSSLSPDAALAAATGAAAAAATVAPGGYTAPSNASADTAADSTARAAHPRPVSGALAKARLVFGATADAAIAGTDAPAAPATAESIYAGAPTAAAAMAAVAGTAAFVGAADASAGAAAPVSAGVTTATTSGAAGASLAGSAAVDPSIAGSAQHKGTATADVALAGHHSGPVRGAALTGSAAGFYGAAAAGSPATRPAQVPAAHPRPVASASQRSQLARLDSGYQRVADPGYDLSRAAVEGRAPVGPSRAAPRVANLVHGGLEGTGITSRGALSAAPAADGVVASASGAAPSPGAMLAGYEGGAQGIRGTDGSAGASESAESLMARREAQAADASKGKVMEDGGAMFMMKKKAGKR